TGKRQQAYVVASQKPGYRSEFVLATDKRAGLLRQTCAGRICTASYPPAGAVNDARSPSRLEPLARVTAQAQSSNKCLDSGVVRLRIPRFQVLEAAAAQPSPLRKRHLREVGGASVLPEQPPKCSTIRRAHHNVPATPPTRSAQARCDLGDHMDCPVHSVAPLVMRRVRSCRQLGALGATPVSYYS